MRKKEKSKDKSTENPNPRSSTSDVFRSIFGDVPQDSSVSLFSDSNPFKRKPQTTTTTPSSQSTEDPNPEDSKLGLENTRNEDFENPNSEELKKRKRKKDAMPRLEDSDNVEEVKKSKKSEELNKLAMLEIGRREAGDADSGMELNGVDGSKKRKKRKREEIEEEYEAKNYGIAAKEEGEKRVVVGEKRKKMDDPGESMVEKEGFDDENKLSRTIFVGNLPLKVKKKVLLKEFSQFGEIESIRIRSVPILDSKLSRKGAILQGKINESADSVHAYIVFKVEQSAQASLSQNLALVGGNHIRVDKACPPHKKLRGDDAPLYDPKRTVFVGNLPFDVKDEEIYKLFRGIKDLESSIEAVRVIRDPQTGAGKGIAYVLFKSRGAANMVIKKRNLKLQDRELRLSHARSDSTPSKRKNPSPTNAGGSPAKKLTPDTRSQNGNGGVKMKGAASYQGLRASKSDIPKKGKKKSIQSSKVRPMPEKQKKANLYEGNRQKGKRPAVAARKAKADALKNGGSSGQAGKKRRLEDRTPESAQRKKKARKFR
ncbi:RNA recognition motif domain [Dillenia turbinata]|uniref:RNA recognition motif domain n=1 Tax=Dillenia turbinata TaxID=194707 RepID=A0AAN8ZUK9_9MAGN